MNLALLIHIYAIFIIFLTAVVVLASLFSRSSSRKLWNILLVCIMFSSGALYGLRSHKWYFLLPLVITILFWCVKTWAGRKGRSGN